TRTADASAAEVKSASPPPAPETSSVSTTTERVVTGPVSFEDAHSAFQENRYDEALRLFTTYTTEQPDNVWGYYMLGLSAWKAGDRPRPVRRLVDKQPGLPLHQSEPVRGGAGTAGTGDRDRLDCGAVPQQPGAGPRAHRPPRPGRGRLPRGTGHRQHLPESVG